MFKVKVICDDVDNGVRFIDMIVKINRETSICPIPTKCRHKYEANQCEKCIKSYIKIKVKEKK